MDENVLNNAVNTMIQIDYMEIKKLKLILFPRDVV
jgi:hypothetical protein